MKIHWIMDVDIIGEKHQNLPKYLRSLGHDVTTLSATKNMPKLVNSPDTVHVFHGSFEELRAVKKQINVATYGLGNSILRSHYASYIPKQWFLNTDSEMTTWGLFRQNYVEYYAKYQMASWWNSKLYELFIRPDSGNKIFTGQVLRKDNFQYEKELLEQTSNILPETIIWITPAQTIHREFRVWISDRQVITASEYSWNEDKKPLKNIPKSVIDFAKKIAEHSWQVDRAYVVDIHHPSSSNDETKIIEFNSFSCSGLYQCDSEKLFKQMSVDIIKEWDE